MSNNVNPIIPSADVEGSFWLSKLRNATVANYPASNGKVKTKRGPNGTSFDLDPSAEGGNSAFRYNTINKWVYSLPDGTDPSTIDPIATINAQVASNFATFGTDTAQWDPGSAYAVGDVVRVLTLMLGGWKDDAHTLPIYILPATWVCVSNVPPYVTTTQLAMLNAITDPDAKAAALANMRKHGNYYAPEWEYTEVGAKEPVQLAHMTTDGNGRYWEMIGLLPGPVVKSCGSTLLIAGVSIPDSPSGLTDVSIYTQP